MALTATIFKATSECGGHGPQPLWLSDQSSTVLIEPKIWRQIDG
jgi:hypothetical protein